MVPKRTLLREVVERGVTGTGWLRNKQVDREVSGMDTSVQVGGWWG